MEDRLRTERTHWQTRWHSTLYLSSGYSQMGMHEKDKQKTAFRTRTVMSFPFFNALATFERLMEQVLDDMTREAPLIYPDGTVIHTKSFCDKLMLR